MIDAITNWDLSVLEFIAEHIKNDFLDVFFRLVTMLGDHGVFWIAVAVIMVLIPRQRKTGLMMGVAMLLGLIIGNGILKNVVARVRPYELVEVALLVERLSDFSFPSGHTLVCFEAATVLTLRKTKLAIPAIIIAVLVAFSRLYLYVHYPTDVIAGAVFGILFGLVGIFVGGRIYDAAAKAIASRRAASASGKNVSDGE